MIKNPLKNSSTIALLAITSLIFIVFTLYQSRELGVVNDALQEYSSRFDALEIKYNKKETQIQRLKDALAEAEKGALPQAQGVSPVQQSIPQAQPARENYTLLGGTQALYTLEVFTDPECPYCKEFHRTAKSIIGQASGMINLQTRLIPLATHGEVAQEEARLAICAGQLGSNIAFYAVLDDIMERTLSNGQGVQGDIKPAKIPADLMQKIKQCSQQEIAKSAIYSNLAAAQQLNLEVTPTTVLRNNKTGEHFVIQGSVPAEELMKVIAQMHVGNKPKKKEK